MKVCSKCQSSKPLDQFHINRAKKDGRGHLCKPCQVIVHREYYQNNKAATNKRNKEYQWKWKYGISSEERDAMVEAVGFACEICSAAITLPTAEKGPYRAHVDHCHTNGHIRGILCQKCNMGLGHYNDDPELMQKAAQYLISRSLNKDNRDAPGSPEREDASPAS